MPDRALPPQFSDVVAAAGRIEGRVLRTPVLRSPAFERRVGREVHFKCENLQWGGAFKLRGAMNAVLRRKAQGGLSLVATHSSGNHGAALALAAQSQGIGCVVVMPADSARTKIAAVEAAGARIVFCPPGTASREAALERVLAESPAQLVHPYDDADVIAGQGTAALELLAGQPGLRILLAPVGGGGLIGGTALVAKAVDPALHVIGAEPANADDTARSLASGRRESAGVPQTIADGLKASIGELNFDLVRRLVDRVVTVREEAIGAAMRTVLEDLKLLIEPSSAVALAALLESGAAWPEGPIGVIVSGGNVDLDRCAFLTSPAA